MPAAERLPFRTPSAKCFPAGPPADLLIYSLAPKKLVRMFPAASGHPARARRRAPGPRDEWSLGAGIGHRYPRRQRHFNGDIFSQTHLAPTAASASAGTLQRFLGLAQ